ncbi:hypothetical protein EWH70_26135 [Amycolatopsis suaedae]|uniref:Uncharacterized protein n=2 Tax=Amycolatopsis suaedae TaxID=2510978 RepID=A0A4Q7J2D8_9PSEU|nr:hypothetical protein EWH70_26135 [Amycolatopsis suaedae]
MTRVLIAGAVLTAGMFATAGAAGAAPVPADADAARSAAAAPSTVHALAGFLGDLRVREGAPAAATAVTVGETVLPVYTLSAEFVAGAAGAEPGRLAYLAVPAVAGDGRTATVQVVRDGGGWTVGNLASGDEEFRLAGKLPGGAVLLHEPQVDAWYATESGRLTVLDPGGSGRAAGDVVTVADYQRAVGERYGDKQAGSGYAADGKAGGYGPSSEEDSPVLPLALGGLGLVAAGVAGLRLRRAVRG